MPSWSAEFSDSAAEPVVESAQSGIETRSEPNTSPTPDSLEETPAEQHPLPAMGEVDSFEDSGDLSFWRRSAGWVVAYRDDISSGVAGMATGIDRFFAGDSALQKRNKSYARIRAGMILEEGNGLSDVSDLKFRLSLPATQKKLRLVIENDSDDDDSLEENNRPSTVSETSDDDDRFSAALQLISSEADLWDTKAEAGLRASAPIDAFVRHTARRRWEISGPWSMNFRQRLAYFKESGYRANEELNFERPISDDWFYRMKTELEWREKVDSMRAAQIFSFYNRIDDKRGIEYQAGTIAYSRHHTVIDNSYLSVNYRQLLYRNWLYLDVIPEIVFPRVDDYDPTSSLTFRLEILFFQE